MHQACTLINILQFLPSFRQGHIISATDCAAESRARSIVRCPRVLAPRASLFPLSSNTPHPLWPAVPGPPARCSERNLRGTRPKPVPRIRHGRNGPLRCTVYGPWATGRTWGPGTLNRAGAPRPEAGQHRPPGRRRPEDRAVMPDCR